jgi:iron complex outermembrane receptor protein
MHENHNNLTEDSRAPATGQSKKKLRLAAILGATALTMPLFAAPAQAQNAPARTTTDTNDIIVTAQRRSEFLEEVPMTVTVVSQERLNNIGINTVRDLQNVTSGFLVNNSGSYPQPAIRGITTINAGAYENNVALFVDGLYQYTAQVLNMDLPNVQNIQVLKGPQGTLYGRNATGGAILIDTLDPSRELTANGELTYGRFDDKRARGYISAPITDRIGFSLAGTFRQTDGYYQKASRTTPGAFDGRTLGLKQGSMRAKVKAELTDNFRVTLGYNYLRAIDPRGVFFTAIENVNTTGNALANATRPQGLGEVAGDVFDLDQKQYETSVKLEWDTPIGTLRSLTGHTIGHLETTYDADGSYAATVYSDSLIRDRTWQEALDFTVNAIEHVDLIVGGTYYNINTRYGPGRENVTYSAPAGSQPGTPLYAYNKLQSIAFWRTKEAWAGFIDVTWHATDKLSVNVGGRYSDETQDVAAEKHNYCTTPADPRAPGCTIGTILPGTVGIPYTRASSAMSSSYNKFTPRASIRYEISPRTNVYASYSQGFRAGEWNSVPPSDTDLSLWKALGQVGQESVNAYEIGIKTAGHRLRADLAGFYYDYKNLQVSSTVFVNGLAIVSLQSVPKAEIYGIEGNVDYTVIDNLNVRAGATWMHARYGDNAVFVGTSVNPGVSTGLNSNPDPLKTFTNKSMMAMDISHMQMARAPDFSAYTGFEYKIPQEKGGFLFAGNVKYTSGYVVTNPSIWGGEPLAAYTARKALDPNALPNNNAQLAGTPYADRSNEQRARQHGFALVNASVTWTDPGDHYYVRAWGNNLTNFKYRVHYNPSSSTYSPIGEPLTFGGTIGYKF